MEKTVKLYDLDSYLAEFSASVISCEPMGEKWAVVLDKTAFFPEGGGQPSDIGTLSNANVMDVQIDENGVITHICDAPMTDFQVCGNIDFARRFNFMQNHSGEHVVSGVIHSLYGLDNIGFHLSEERYVTLDFNGDLTRTQLDDIELRANRILWSNRYIKAYYPDEETLKALSYRSKKDIDGDVRIVEIEGCDTCACCAPHVKTTAEIGIIKLLDTEKMHGGTRIVMKCGEWALQDYKSRYNSISRISALTSAKAEETPAAVEGVLIRLSEEKQTNTALKRRLITEMIKSADAQNSLFFEEGLDIKELQLYADGLFKAYGGIKAVFSKSENGYCFAICGEPSVLDPFFADLRTRLNIRGGGRNGMVQGTANADEETIKLCFQF